MPDGYYIYNPDEETVTWKLDGQTIYTFPPYNFSSYNHFISVCIDNRVPVFLWIHIKLPYQYAGDAVFLPDRGWNGKGYSGEADCIRAVCLFGRIVF